MFRYPIPFRLGEPVRRSYTVTLEDGAVKSYAYWVRRSDGSLDRSIFLSVR